MKIIISPYSEESLGDILNKKLNGEIELYNSFTAAVAFLKLSGVQHIYESLEKFKNGKNKVKFIVGIDQNGTSKEALEKLLELTNDDFQIWINHCRELYITFHPKLYFFEGISESSIIIGSGNLTEGGLYTNDEASSINRLIASNEDDNATIKIIKAYIDKWSLVDNGNSKILDKELLNSLVENGYVSTESKIRKKMIDQITDQNKENSIELFLKSTIARSKPKKIVSRKTNTEDKASTDEIPINNDNTGFLMTLQRTDVGTGQTTKGSHRRSPEIFIPLIARKANEDFWGWKELFSEDPNKPGKFDRAGVKMRIGREVINVNMMTWPDKSDFRLRSEALRSAGEIGDILRIEKIENPNYEYYVEIIPKDTISYKVFQERCNNPTRNSKKMWGYY